MLKNNQTYRYIGVKGVKEKLSTETLQMLGYCIKFNVLLKLWLCTVYSFSSLYREYRYIEDRYIGVLSHTVYCNIFRDIEYSSLYREYRYIEDRYIGVPLYYGH